jgi:hypothetical protein
MLPNAETLASHSTISVSGFRPPYPWPRRKRQADCNLTGALITTKHIQGGSIGLSNNFLREQCVRRGAWRSYNGTQEKAHRRLFCTCRSVERRCQRPAFPG